MKLKETLKRIVSFATSLAVTSTFLPNLAANAESPTEIVESFPYTLFASSTENGAITITSNNACVNGSVATNGTIETSASNFNVNGSVYENCDYNVPNMVSSLYERFFSEDNIESYSEDYVVEDTNINITVPMDVDGTLEFMGNVNISSSITVLDNIIFNGEVENSSDSIICSETGDITIDTTNVNLNGLIYAPNGCVNITAQNLCLNNIIVIADSIVIDCPSFNANYSNHFGLILGEEIDKVRNDINADFDSDGLTDAYETYIIIKFDDINSLVGHPLDFTHEDISFEDGTLSFKLDDFILSEHSIDNLAIVWYNYDTNEIEFLDTTVVDGNTISAHVDHFSTYGIVDLSLFFDDICWNNDIELTKKGRADIVFAIDTTSSMGNAISKVKQYVNKFASGLENKDVNYRFGLVEYRDLYEDGLDTTINHGWYNDADSFKTAISNLSVSGGGDDPESAVDALYTARNMKYRPSVNKYIVLVTDVYYKNGIRSNRNYTMDDEIKELSKNNFCVSVVSYGYSQYNKLVNETHGITAGLDSDFSVSLNGLISKIGNETQGGYWIRLSNGSVVKLDKNPEDGDEDFDTDKDGIPDLVELKSKTTKRVYNPITRKIEDITTWSFYSNPSQKDSDGDGLTDIDDLSPTVFDTRVTRVDDNSIAFNTGKIWFKVHSSAQDIFGYIRSGLSGQRFTDEEIQIIEDDMNSIYSFNNKREFTFDELCFIGILDNEGSKFYLEEESTTTRDKIFKTLCNRNTKYFAHVGVGNEEEDWEEVNSYNDGHWYGKVFSESDLNFTLKPYTKFDFLDYVPVLVAAGVLIIAVIVIYEVTPIVIANIQMLNYYCSTFGIKDGIGMWYNFGAAGCPDGIITMLEMDLADGDTNIDDVLLIKSQETVNNKLNNYLLNPEHEHGAPKAKWFKEALGFSRENMDQLAKQIIFDKNQATPTALTEYGQKYEQIIKIVGANGREIDVKFAWIINNGNEFASLVTAIPTKK